MTVTASHRPVPSRPGSRCRMDCSCGWRGKPGSTFGECQTRWNDHFYRARAAESEGERCLDCGAEFHIESHRQNCDWWMAPTDSARATCEENTDG